MKKQRNNKGQAMVEYIIIVVLIAITLIVLFSKFGGAIGKKVAGAAEILDSEANTAELVGKLGQGDELKRLNANGTFDD